jgi:hypothetical protein
MGGILIQRIALCHLARVRSITISGAAPSDARGLRLLRHLRPGFIMRMARLRFPEDHQGHIAFGLAVTPSCLRGYPFGEAVAREGIEQMIRSCGPPRHGAPRHSPAARGWSPFRPRPRSAPALWPVIAGEIRALADRAPQPRPIA